MPDTTPDAPLLLDAPHRALLDQVLDRWSLQVLEVLCEAPARFNQLRRAVPGVSQKSLSTTLRRLERNGIVERTVGTGSPVSVTYAITPLGKTLRDPVDAVLLWAREHLPAVEAARAAHDAREEDALLGREPTGRR